MSTAVKVADPRAVKVRLTDEELIVLLDDGRTVTAPIADFPRLAYATEEELRDNQFIGGGTGIHWPQIDEDISIETLLVGGRAPGETAASFERWKEEMDRRRAVAEKEPWGETLPLPPWWVMTKEQRGRCHKIIHIASISAAAVGAGLAQVPGGDAVLIAPIQIVMIVSLGKVFGISVNKTAARSTAYASLGTAFGRGFTRLFARLPLIGNATNAATAATITEVLGWAVAKQMAAGEFPI